MIERIPFLEFWTWLQSHPNCVLRAGSASVCLLDDDALHWGFVVENEETFVMQMALGKRLVGELVLSPAELSFVQQRAGESGEFLFDLHSSDPEQVLFQIVLSHAYPDESAVEAPSPSDPGSRWTH